MWYDGYREPSLARIRFEGFEDPLTALKQIERLLSPLRVQVRVEGFEDPLTALVRFEDPLTALAKGESFEDPLTAHVQLEGFEDPLTALEKLRFRTAAQTMQATCQGLKGALRIQTSPPR